ncbi:MAG: MazG nucleotide pyrophosphohydrolase domain-containing protein, partial [Pseudomonadota bacterium]|nr:MazG nucleotide pyrophosphohydrolase domain-containing protein [Pseudomonadota bacterium]
ARMGFDWPESSGVLNKMQEELDEIRQAVAVGDTNNAAIEEEVGDFLFAAANLARHLGVEPEEALRSANFKFQRRFKAMELEIKKTGKSVRSSSLDELEAAWGQAKRQEKLEV